MFVYFDFVYDPCLDFFRFSSFIISIYKNGRHKMVNRDRDRETNRITFFEEEKNLQLERLE